MPVVVRLRAGDARSEAIWARIGGQTVDLDVALTRVPDRGEARVARQVAVAARLAKRERARVVIWFRRFRRGRGVIIYIAEPAADRVFVRRLAQSGRGPDARSTTAEAAALVVRSALRALAAGSQIGVSTREAVRTAEQAHDATPPEQPQPVPTPPPSPPQPERPKPALGGVVTASWQALRDGIGRSSGLDMHHGVALMIGAERGPWRLSAGFGFHPAISSRDDLTAIRIGRYQAALGLAWRRPVAVGTLELALAAGPVWFRRTSQALAPGVTVTPPSTTAALSLGPSIGLWIALPQPGDNNAHDRDRDRDRWQLGLGAGADMVVGAPAFAYQRDRETIVRERMDSIHVRAFGAIRWHW